MVLLSGKTVSSADRLEIDKTGGVLGFIAKAPTSDGMAQVVYPFLDHAAWQARVRSFEHKYGYGGDRIVFDTHATRDEDEVTISFSRVQSVVSDSRTDKVEEPVLPAETCKEIDEFMEIFLDARKRAELKIKQPKGLLLYGPPGNGKTMVARSLARQMRCNCIAVAAGDFQSHWAGMASEKLRELFEQARMRQPCVVFIDEIDAVAPKRVADSGSGVIRDQAGAVATLLTQLDGFEGGGEVFVIGATNRKDAIDDALLRPGRLDRLIEVGKPGLEQRKEILQRILSAHSTIGIEMAWAASECYGLSCAEIVRVIQDSALLALRRFREYGNATTDIGLNKDDFREAVDRIRFGSAPPKKETEGAMQRNLREVTAWHEAGHLILGIALLGEIPDRVTIVPRGDFGGYVRTSEEDFERRIGTRRRSSCLAEMAVLLGGGIAEQTKYGEHSAGVSQDRRHALHLAYAMVAKWGMGPLEAEVQGYISDRTFTGGDNGAALSLTSRGSEVALASGIADLMQEATDLAEKEMSARGNELKQAAQLLLKKEELDRTDVEKEFSTLIQAYRPAMNGKQ